MKHTTIHVTLSEKLGVKESERFLNILDAMFTPEEAAICLELFEPATCDELSNRLDTDARDMQDKLDLLVDRGMLTRGPTQYAFHTSLLAFHHECVADTAPQTGPYALPQHVKDMWGDFFRQEWSYEFMKKTEERIAAGGRNLPISPSIVALERSPNISPDEIHPEENFKLKIEKAKRRIIAPCGCRVVWGKCNHPLMTCFACFDRPRGEYYLNQPGRLLKEVTLAESLDIAREAEESGLVHWGDCYCCDDCCENLFPVTRDKRWDLMTPNRYLAVIDEDKCRGCQICIDRCPFEAIEMRKSTSSKRYKAYVVPEKCKGCGLCIVKCPHNAMRYEVVRPWEYLSPPPPPSSPGDGPRRTIPVWGHYYLK